MTFSLTTPKGLGRGWLSLDDQFAQQYNNNLQLLDDFSLDGWAYDRDASYGLVFAYRGGTILTGGAWTKIANGTVTLADEATNYVQYDTTGAVTANTSGFDADQSPIAIVVTTKGGISTVTDYRSLGAGSGSGTGTGLTQAEADGLYAAIGHTHALVDLSDVNMTPGAGTDGYAVTWNNASSRFVLSYIAGAPSGQALTRVNDTNVTITLGGSPTTALLAATSLTLGWSGQLGVARGGTSIASYTTGDLIYASSGSTLDKLAVGTASQVLKGGTTPGWGTLALDDLSDVTITTPSTGQVLQKSAGNWVNATLSVNVANIGNAVGQALIRSSNDGSAWEVYSGASLGNFLKLQTSGGSEYQWAGADITAADVASGTFKSGSGTYTFDGASVTISGVGTRLRVTNTEDITLAGLSGGLIVGGDGTGQHLALDGNELQSKTSPTVAGTLQLQPHGGIVSVGASVALNSMSVAATTLDVSAKLNVDPGVSVTYNGSATKTNTDRLFAASEYASVLNSPNGRQSTFLYAEYSGGGSGFPTGLYQVTSLTGGTWSGEVYGTVVGVEVNAASVVSGHAYGLIVSSGTFSSGNVAAYTGIKIGDFYDYGSGSLTGSQIGLFISNLTTGSGTNYAIWTDGTQACRFGGEVQSNNGYFGTAASELRFRYSGTTSGIILNATNLTLGSTNVLPSAAGNNLGSTVYPWDLVAQHAYSPQQTITVGSGETTKNVDFASGNTAKATMSNSSSCAFTLQNPQDGGCYTLILMATGAGRSFSFTNTIDWITDAPVSPLSQNYVIVCTFYDHGGTGLLGFATLEKQITT